MPHRRLLGKLSAYGIQGKHSELDQRFLVWKISNSKSKRRTISTSCCHQRASHKVPSLGPLLFVIYINDILDNIKSEGLLFADDTKIFHSILTREDALTLESDITTLEEWSKRWLLRFNPDKYHVLSLGRFDNIMYTHRYSIYSKEMEHVFEEKDLGITMDSDLTFAEHISNKVKVCKMELLA